MKYYIPETGEEKDDAAITNQEIGNITDEEYFRLIKETNNEAVD